MTVPALSDDDLLLREEAERADEAMCRLAREDPCTFAEYVLRDDATGQRIALAPMHEDWHDLWSRPKGRVVIWSHVEGGKTSQVAGRVLWELGRNPNLRIAVISNTQPQAIKIGRAIRGYIEKSADLRRVFPCLLPGDQWGEESFTVKRDSFAKEPSVQCFGSRGAVLGARLDLVILDDVLRWENTLTARRMEDLRAWVYSTLFGRVTAQGRVWVLGNAYHPDDLLHYLEKQPRWIARRYPVMDPLSGEPRWPEQWPADRIKDKRDELGPLEFARQMMCIPRDDEAARFKRAWIDRALEQGEGRDITISLTHVPEGYRSVTGIDLAVEKKKKNDRSSAATLIVHPDQARELLSIESAKMHGPEIVQWCADLHQRYHSILWVESNGAQAYITQFLRADTAVPVKTFNTGSNKHSPAFGVESLATEMAGGKWIFPCRVDPETRERMVHPEIEKLIEEMLFYDPAGHTGDRLMSLWIAREGARTQGGTVQRGRLALLRR